MNSQDWNKQSLLYKKTSDAIALVRTNPTEALKVLEELANEGSIICMIHLGSLLQNSNKIPKNLKQARYWYEQAYKISPNDGRYFLADFCLKENDIVKAEELFLEGVEQNDFASMGWLAYIYLDIKKENDAQALELLRKAAAAGNVRSERYLGKLMMEGRLGKFQYLKGLFLAMRSIIRTFIIAAKDTNDLRLK